MVANMIHFNPTLFILSLVTTFQWTCGLVQPANDFKFIHEPMLNDKVCLSGDQNFTIQAASKINCGQLCSQNENCRSFSFSPSTMECTGCVNVLTLCSTCQTSPSPTVYYYKEGLTSPGLDVSGPLNLGADSDCFGIKENNNAAPSGIYNVTLSSGRTISVYCDMDTEGGGWTVFQYRFDGSVDFYRTFQEYACGRFGDVLGEFWLGLQNIHEMAPPEIESEIYVYLHDGYNMSKVLPASSFSVGVPPCYRVTLRFGDPDLLYNDGACFSAKDFGPKEQCSVARQSGWWHVGCTWINPNGLYVTPGTVATSPSGWAGIVHVPWQSFRSMAVTKLMFRRVVS